MEKDTRYTPEHDLQRRDSAQVYSDPQLGSMAGTQANREPKAHHLLHAIQSMEIVVERLCALRDTIEQGNVPRTGPQDCPAPFEPSVANLLSEGPQIIQGQHTRMMDVITQIESTLF